jgi:hypothetical protein
MLIACNTRHFVKNWIVTQKVSHPANNHPSAIFLESFDSLHGEDNYLLGIIFPYLESFHLSRYGVSTYVQHNPFGRITCINFDDLGQFKMLFLKCSSGCKPSFCNNEKLKMK